MSSPNNGNPQYPALPGTSGTSAETFNNNAVTNSNAQQSVNNASTTHFNNDANGTFNNTAGGSSNTPTNQEFNQTSATTRQTRSSARAAKINLKALGSLEDLDSGELRKQREYEIN